MKRHHTIARILRALANERRLEILCFLKPQKQRTVSVIANHLRLSIRSTSKHPARLSAVEIIEKEQKSTSVFYRINETQEKCAARVIDLL